MNVILLMLKAVNNIDLRFVTRIVKSKTNVIDALILLVVDKICVAQLEPIYKDIKGGVF